MGIASRAEVQSLYRSETAMPSPAFWVRVYDTGGCGVRGAGCRVRGAGCGVRGIGRGQEGALGGGQLVPHGDVMLSEPAFVVRGQKCEAVPRRARI